MESGSGGGTSASLETHQKANVWPGKFQDPTEASAPASLEKNRSSPWLRVVRRLWQKTRRPTNCSRREEKARPEGNRMRSLLGSRLFLANWPFLNQRGRSG